MMCTLPLLFKCSIIFSRESLEAVPMSSSFFAPKNDLLSYMTVTSLCDCLHHVALLWLWSNMILF